MDGLMYDKYSELQRKYRIIDHTVRIEIVQSSSVGTGFLYTIKGSTYVYIMTACHVICRVFKYGEETIINIGYSGKNKNYKKSELGICTLYDESEQTAEFCEKLEDEDAGGDTWKIRYKDIAVLRIKKLDFVADVSGLSTDFCWLSEGKIERGMKFVGNGFPDQKTQCEDLYGLCYTWEDENQMITCKAENISYQPFEEAMKGFSGTGLVAEYKGGPVFIGVVAACDNEEKHQQFRIAGTTQIAKKLGEIGWEIFPEYDAAKPPERFYRGNIQNLQNEYLKYMDNAAKQLICKEIIEIDRENLPCQMAEDEKFYDIPFCGKNRRSCEHYWCGRVWPMLVSKFLSGDKKNTYYKSKDGKELPIKYICSEGNGKADLASVVEAAVNSSVLGQQILGDSILIWQSEGNPSLKRLFPKESFKNIISSIAYGDSDKYKDISRNAAYDLLDGEMRKKNYGIVHIQHIIDELGGCNTEQDAKKKIGEIFDGLWE